MEKYSTTGKSIKPGSNKNHKSHNDLVEKKDGTTSRLNTASTHRLSIGTE